MYRANSNEEQWLLQPRMTFFAGQGKCSYAGNIFYRSIVDKLLSHVKEEAGLGPKYNEEDMVKEVIRLTRLKETSLLNGY